MLRCIFCGKNTDKVWLDICDVCLGKHEDIRKHINEQQRILQQVKGTGKKKRLIKLGG